jgi:hypothetical protein
MKILITLLTLFALLPLLCCKEKHGTRPTEHDGLATRVRAVLPQNWSLDETSGQIIISRKESITTHGCIGLDLSWARHPELLREDVEKYGVQQAYKIRLRFGPRLGIDEFARLKQTNSQIRVTKGTVIEAREFYEDGAMQSFDPRYRELPLYYDEKSSVYVETTVHPWECIYPPDVARECERVRRILDSLLTRYPEAESRSTLSWMGL